MKIMYNWISADWTKEMLEYSAKILLNRNLFQSTINFLLQFPYTYNYIWSGPYIILNQNKCLCISTYAMCSYLVCKSRQDSTIYSYT